jgi:hypothetical protein
MDTWGCISTDPFHLELARIADTAQKEKEKELHQRELADGLRRESQRRRKLSSHRVATDCPSARAAEDYYIELLQSDTDDTPVPPPSVLRAELIGFVPRTLRLRGIGRDIADEKEKKKKKMEESVLVAHGAVLDTINAGRATLLSVISAAAAASADTQNSDGAAAAAEL